MSFDDLQELIRRRPFRPFRVHLTDGSSLEVRHPDMFMIGRRSVTIGLAADPMQTFYDRATMVDLLHIMGTEPLEVSVQPGNAGTS